MVLEPELQTSPRWDSAKQRKEPPNETLLRRVVDACAANVIALDETGAVLHASRAWRILQAKADFLQLKNLMGWMHSKVVLKMAGLIRQRTDLHLTFRR